MTNAALRVLSIVYTVACILTGEVGVVPQAALPVARVAYERLPIWGYGGWNAIADEPADWAMDAAWEAWKLGGDGNLFALSEADIIKLGSTSGIGETLAANVGRYMWERSCDEWTN